MQNRDVWDRHSPNMDGAVSDSLDTGSRAAISSIDNRRPNKEDLKHRIAKAMKRLESVDTLVLEDTSSVVEPDD